MNGTFDGTSFEVVPTFMSKFISHTDIILSDQGQAQILHAWIQALTIITNQKTAAATRTATLALLRNITIFISNSNNSNNYYISRNEQYPILLDLECTSDHPTELWLINFKLFFSVWWENSIESFISEEVTP